MKAIIFFTLFSLTLSTINAQQKKFSWENVRYGGGVTLNLGNQTTIGISPSALYDFKNGLTAGFGIGYLYSEPSRDSSISAFNFSAITIYESPFSLMLSAELEQYFSTQRNNTNRFSSSFPALHLGIAYQRGNFAVGVRYDVLYDENRSIFASPISPIARFFF